MRSIDVRTGTEGLQRKTLSVTNLSRLPIICNAQLAHWYSVVLLEVAGGNTGDIVFWCDPGTGTIAVLNDSRENMPVEAAWCGIAGQAYKTRSILKLDRRASSGATAKSISCMVQNDRLACR